MTQRTRVGGASSGGSIEASFRIWVNRRTRSIHFASKKAGIISTVSEDPKSERYHPNLYGKLRAFLKREGHWPDELSQDL